jgi:hypothetical protein
MVYLVQTVHLFFTNTDTVSKQIKMRIHMTHITKLFYQVCPKWFSSSWYARRKPCTYLASRLAQSPNRLKWASAWASSPTSTIGSVQNDFWALVCLAQTMYLSCIDTNTVSRWIETIFHITNVTEEIDWVRPKWFLSPWCVRRKPCTSHTLTLIMSPNGPKWDSTWLGSPRCSFGCVQNDFWTYGKFSTNRAPILHQD